MSLRDQLEDMKALRELRTPVSLFDLRFRRPLGVPGSDGAFPLSMAVMLMAMSCYAKNRNYSLVGTVANGVEMASRVDPCNHNPNVHRHASSPRSSLAHRHHHGRLAHDGT